MCIRDRPQALSLQDVFERSIGAFGSERVLFGTDSGTFPAGWRADRRKEQESILQSLGLSDSEREAILGGNARRILRLP